MQAAELLRDGGQIGDYPIAGQLDVPREMGGKRAVAAPGQQLGAAPDAVVAVQRHGDVNVVKEFGEARRFRRVEPGRRQVVRVVVRMTQQLHRSARSLGGAFGDQVGHLLQAAPVDGEEAEAGPQLARLDDAGLA